MTVSRREDAGCSAFWGRFFGRIARVTSVEAVTNASFDLVATAPRMPNIRPVEIRDFLGNFGALLTGIFGIVGADRRHSGGT